MKTRIVATIGPASASISELIKMIRAGMRVARLNFSHGTHEEHVRHISMIRRAEKRSREDVLIIQDLQGPRVRLGMLPDEGIEVFEKERVTFAYEHARSTSKEAIPVTYKRIADDVKKGHRILIDDGEIVCEVTKVSRGLVHANVVTGGILYAHKGINLPDSTLSVASCTKKDVEDLRIGVKAEVDYIALSFIREVDTIHKIREEIMQLSKKCKTRPPHIIVKIETREALEHLEAIIEAADAIMIARGDLGLELPPEEVPIIQKDITEFCRAMGRPVIVATHMLHSMTHHLRATRAETSDVANAVFDGVDAVMLSNETAVGDRPAFVVETMAKIIQEAERSHLHNLHPLRPASHPHDTTDAFAQSIHLLAQTDDIGAIGLLHADNGLLMHLCMYQPDVPVYVGVQASHLERKMILHRGLSVVSIPNTTKAGQFALIGAIKKHLPRGKKLLLAEVGSKQESITILS
ncbi:MAG: pyruvate kinase [bacterium]|nr:pyruvate kinase [bacterium]